jgi:hypothetical protein
MRFNARRQRARGLICSVAVAVIFVACANSHGASEPAAPVATQQRLPTIDHVSPARDSVGGPPMRFEWTAAKDADQYMIGVWDDVDRLIWEENHIRGTSIAPPTDIEFPFGTYFWMVTALRNDRAVAESGRAAFVVMK